MYVNQQKLSTIVESLVAIQNTHGYITFDDLLDAADKFGLPLSQIDQLASQINGQGYKIFDHKPSLLEQAEAQAKSAAKQNKYADYAQTNYEAVYQEVLKMDPGLSSLIDYIREIRPAQYGEYSYLFHHVDQKSVAKKRLFDMHLRAVVRIAVNEAKSRNEELADLIQLGSLGLLSAIEKYDADSDTAFGAYASYWIYMFISKNVPFRRNKCYFPVHISDSILSVVDIIDNHSCPKCSGNYLLCENLVGEIMFKLQKDRPTTVHIIKCTQRAESIEAIAEREFEKDIYLSDYCEFDNLMVERIQEFQKVHFVSQALGTLKDKEKNIIEMRYGFHDGTCWTLEECGTYYGVTRERIRQIEEKALRKLKHSSYSKKLLSFYE